MAKYLCTIPSFSLEIEAKNKKSDKPKLNLWIVFYWAPGGEQRDFTYVIASSRQEARALVKKIAKEDWTFTLKDKDIVDLFCVEVAADKNNIDYNVIVQPK